MTKQITKEEALQALEDAQNKFDTDEYFEIVEQYIEQDNSQEEAKTLEEIEDAFCSQFVEDDKLTQGYHYLHIVLFIKLACKQYTASKDKEIQTLSKDLITVIEQKKEYIQENETLKLNEEANQAYYADTLAEVTREIESLRQTVSDLSQKLDMMGYEG